MSRICPESSPLEPRTWDRAAPRAIVSARRGVAHATGATSGSIVGTNRGDGGNATAREIAKTAKMRAVMSAGTRSEGFRRAAGLRRAAGFRRAEVLRGADGADGSPGAKAFRRPSLFPFAPMRAPPRFRQWPAPLRCRDSLSA